MIGLRRFLFRDLGTKMLALVLALAIYVHVFSGQERELVFRIPLHISPLPSGLALAGEYPDVARVRVRAVGADLVKLTTRDFGAVVQLEEPGEGNLQRPVLGSDVRFPRGIHPVQVEILEPTVLNLSIEPVTNTWVPVTVRFAEPMPADRAMSRQPETTPKTVRISGPKSLVSSVDSLETMPLGFDGESGKRTQEVAVRVPARLSAEPESVLVHLHMEARKIERYAPIPVELHPRQGEGLIWFFPDSGAVIVEGAESLVGRIKANRIRLLADIRAPVGGAQRVALRAIVPGLPAAAPIRVRCDPESISVRFK